MSPANIGNCQRHIKHIFQGHGDSKKNQKGEAFDQTDPFESTCPFGLFCVHFVPVARLNRI